MLGGKTRFHVPVHHTFRPPLSCNCVPRAGNKLDSSGCIVEASPGRLAFIMTRQGKLSDEQVDYVEQYYELSLFDQAQLAEYNSYFNISNQ